MKRFRNPVLAAAIVTLAALPLAFAACGGDDNGEPKDVPLADVVADQDSYNGDTLRLQGTVVGFEEAVEHYVIEDENQNRVELVPTDQAAEYEGQEVSVVGRFTFADDQGRRIEIEKFSFHIGEDGGRQLQLAAGHHLAHALHKFRGERRKIHLLSL